MNPVVRWFHQLGSPPYFDRFSARWAPVAHGLGLLVMAYGLYGALFVVPADYQQGDSFRILYIHVPAAWMSLFVFGLMAFYAAIAQIWRIKLCETLAMASAPVGAAFTFITLATGSLWGKPMWGTWWTWDARLTSELVLLFLYFGVIGLYHAIEDTRTAARAAAFLALVGVVNLPIVHYSVTWWNTLHQGSTVSLMGGSHISGSMLWPLLTLAFATHVYFFASVLARTRSALLALESGKDWVRNLVMQNRSVKGAAHV